jgi:hypothetical protein
LICLTIGHTQNRSWVCYELDSYIARPDGAVDFLVKDKDSSRLKAEFFATV